MPGVAIKPFSAASLPVPPGAPRLASETWARGSTIPPCRRTSGCKLINLDTDDNVAAAVIPPKPPNPNPKRHSVAVALFVCHPERSLAHPCVKRSRRACPERSRRNLRLLFCLSFPKGICCCIFACHSAAKRRNLLLSFARHSERSSESPSFVFASKIGQGFTRAVPRLFSREAGGPPIILGAPFIAVSSRWVGPFNSRNCTPGRPVAPHRAFEMGLQTLPSPSLPADSRIGRARVHPAYLISLNLKLQKPVKPLGAQKSLNQHKLNN